MVNLTAEQIRHFMELSVEIMKDSIQEKRQDDKPSPFVGAVLVRDDMSVETAYRGELREGDHAEFTLLERKCRSERVTGYTLFSTLEPCAHGARRPPKLSCAERIVNARIKKIYIGIENPDPTVCRKGIKYLMDNGIDVEMYPRDLQVEIEKCNKCFLTAAIERAQLAEKAPQDVILSNTENVIEKALVEDLSEELIKKFMEKAKLGEYNTSEGLRVLLQLGLIGIKHNEQGETVYMPTGQGLLLFGKKPELTYPNAVIRATYRTNGQNEDIETIGGPLVAQPDKIFNWYEKHLNRQIDRSVPKRKYFYSYPIEVINELVKNAILHRDYDIEGAPIYLEINDDFIIIKSPGCAVPPIRLDQIASFNAPSLSRNPKIMYVFDKLDLAEQRGLGFSTVRELPEKYGLLLPLVGYEAPYLVFKLPRNVNAVRKGDNLLAELDDGEIKMINFFKLNENQSFGKGKVIEKLSIPSRTAERALKHLVDLGYIVRVGGGRSTVYQLAK